MILKKKKEKKIIPTLRPSLGLAATVLGLLPAILGSVPMVVMVVLLLLLLLSGGQLRRAGTPRRRRAGRRGTLVVVLQLRSFVLLGGALFRVLGDTFGGDPLAPFAHVSSQWAFLLLLAKRARVLGGFALGLTLSGNGRLFPLLVQLNSTALWWTVQRVLQRSIRELLVVPVQRITERPILDTITHVVHIHLEGAERRGGGGGYRGEANVGLERALREGFGNL